jgi:hypothetical protein
MSAMTIAVAVTHDTELAGVPPLAETVINDHPHPGAIQRAMKQNSTRVLASFLTRSSAFFARPAPPR